MVVSGITTDASGPLNLPKSNQSFWGPKLLRNRARDAEYLKALKADGWDCLVLWECELVKPIRVGLRIAKFLER